MHADKPVAHCEKTVDRYGSSAAQRVIDDRRAALLRRYAPGPAYGVDYDDAGYADAGAYAPYGGYGYLAFAPAQRQRSPEARSDRRSVRQSVVPVRPRLPVR